MPRVRSLVTELLLAVVAIVRALAHGDVLRPFVGIARDALRSRAELLAENALLRQQVLVLRRLVTRPRLVAADRWWMVVAARVAAGWREAVLIVQPATLLRWHRDLHRRWWRCKSRERPRADSRIAADTIALIREMAAANRLWGADRIRGELLKLGLRVSKRTVQKYMRRARTRPPSGPRWSTFLREHAKEIWACDFLQLHDALFRPIFAFFVVAHGTREIIQMGVTRSPSDAWVAQQLRNATPDGHGPRFLLRDRDQKYGRLFDRVATGIGARVLRTPVRAPRANALCERFLGSVRRECLDHVLLLD
jgi:hypothetical protein